MSLDDVKTPTLDTGGAILDLAHRFEHGAGRRRRQCLLLGVKQT